MAKDALFVVRVQYDARDAGHTYGPFDKRDEAEACVVALAGRTNVLSAKIEESTP